ncbi:AMP-binding protein [Gammaproteobacteria bacterium]|nr:AMP-binding protein [Gammaproteobacteria bacterium]MDA7786787.1 AMP-binding protein [Gammaproteobacteria bacterium]MDA7802884.1 AMP-binding protein [Gammaproteobacteria bacterium]MDA9045361.1 AMP-binding protein [Gammaproteobacteria bacterium]MDA9117643.1 AMP-binding protein [Gammaproteobacteria bacterium]
MKINDNFELHLATIWEHISDLVPNELACISGDEKKTWSEYEKTSARIASFLNKRGVKKDTKVGLYLFNCSEYLTSQFAIMKVMGVPINVNYRYQSDELVYLFDNSDSEVVFFHESYSDQVKQVYKKLPGVKTWIQIGGVKDTEIDGCFSYEEIISSNDPMERIVRDEDNIYMIYTGGTTGMPKGVMYNHGEFSVAMYGGLKSQGYEVPDMRFRENIKDLKEIIIKKSKSNDLTRCLIACPLMHGTGMFLGGFMTHCLGGSIITIPEIGLNPEKILSEISTTGANNLVIVGDAFAKPLLRELDAGKEKAEPYDISSLNIIISSGVIWSAEIKQGILEHHDVKLFDSMGSSEGGMASSVSSRKKSVKTAKFKINPDVIVLGDDGAIVEPGSGIRGLVGTSGMVPQGYYKDPVKSAQTFKEVHGKRYSFPGDYALVEEDGSITLLGRGSNCINSAGEKIYPEEVEEALKLNINIDDVLVVGVDDEKFGQKVVAVASFNEGMGIEEHALREETKKHLSSYKVPKNIKFVDKVNRAPNGKADYKWAAELAKEFINV